MPRTVSPLPLLALVLSWVAASPPAAADAATLGARARQADAAAARALEALADWCAATKLFRRRDEVYVLLLQVEPEHTKARQKLHYEKRSDGTWTQRSTYTRPQDYTPGAQAEFEERRAAVLDAWTKARLAVWAEAATLQDLRLAWTAVEGIAASRPDDDEAKRSLEGTVLRFYRAAREAAAPEDMERAARFLRERAPQDPIVHATLREVPVEGGWRLQETVRALQAAARWPAVAKAALAEVAVEPEALTPVESRVTLPWKSGSATADVRAVGTAEAAVLASLARMAQAAGPVFRAALGRSPERRKGLTFYVFAAPGEFEAFLQAFPVVDNPTLRNRKTLGLDLVFTSGQGMAVKENPPEAQADLAVGTLFNQLLSDTCLRGGTPRGWHTEGISRYLTWRLAGTRLSVGVMGDYAGQGGDRVVPESGDPWLERARAALLQDPAIGLDLFLGKGLDAYGTRDSLLAFAFAVYLLDGFDAKSAPFVEAFEAESSAETACRRVLGMPREVVERRFRRWLDEMVAAQQVPSAAPK